MEKIVVPIFTQLGQQAPVLFVYFVGVLLALVFWRRYPAPAALTLLAMCIFLIGSIGHTILIQYVIQSRDDLELSAERLGWTLSAMGLLFALLRALGTILLLSAVFVGRSALAKPV